MKITVEIDIPTTDVPALAAAIGSTPASIEQGLQGHAQAAVDEYIAMYLARETPASGSELRQLRLALLAERVFTDGLPDEETVAGLFQLTLPASRTLIRNTMTRYRTRLEASMKAAGKAVMDEADWADDLLEISIPSASLVEAMTGFSPGTEATTSGSARNRAPSPSTPRRQPPTRCFARPTVLM